MGRVDALSGQDGGQGMSRGDYAAHQGLSDTAAEHERVMRVLAPRPETLRDVRERHELLADLGEAEFDKALERAIGRAALWVMGVSLALLALVLGARWAAVAGYVSPGGSMFFVLCAFLAVFAGFAFFGGRR